MFSTTTRIVRVVTVVLGVCLVAQVALLQIAHAGSAAAPHVLRADQLKKGQLKTLPDTIIIEFEGQRLTVGAIRARARERDREAAAKAQVAAGQVKAKLEQRRIQFEQQRQAKLQADNARAMAEFTRQSQASGPAASPQLDAIQQEAAQLFERSKRASSAEQAQIEQRAGQLLQQLQQLGR